MQRQTMRVDFDVKTQVKAPFRYKQGEVDNNGIEFELVNVDLVGLSGAVYAHTPSELKLEPQSLVIEGNKAVYIPPTNEAGDYKLELVMYNSNGKTKSADVVMTVVESLSATISDYETLYEQVTRKEAEFTANENTRIENETVRIDNENARIEAENARVESMEDITTQWHNLTTAQQQEAEVMNARERHDGTVYPNLKERLDADTKNIISTVNVSGTETVTTNETLDGVASGTELVGQTLVNMWDKKQVSNATVEDGFVVPKGNSSANYMTGGGIPPKPNSSYTIVVFVEELSLPSGGVVNFVSSGLGTTTFAVSFKPLTFATTGTYVINGTAISDLTGKSLWYGTWYSVADVGNRVKYRAIILEGDHTDKPLSFFEGLKSSELSEIESSNADKTKSSKTTLSEPIILRSLPNGVADTYDVDTRVLTRRCGEVVLNGSESDWGMSTTGPTKSMFVLYNYPSDITTSNPNASTISKIYCDKLLNSNTSEIDSGAIVADKALEGISQRIDGSKGLFITIAKSKLATPDVAGFKAWLSANPTTVVYRLATPTTEIVDNSGLIRSYDNQTTLTAESVVPADIKSTVVTGTGENRMNDQVVQLADRILELEKEPKQLNADIFSGTDSEKIQKAYDYLVENHKYGIIELSRKYVVDNSIMLKPTRYDALGITLKGGQIELATKFLFSSLANNNEREAVRVENITFTTTLTEDVYVYDCDNMIKPIITACNFEGVNCAYSTNYIQSVYISNSDIRNNGAFISAPTIFDGKIRGNRFEVSFKTNAHVVKVFGTPTISYSIDNLVVTDNLIEGYVNTVPLILGSTKGLLVSGTYTEQNKGFIEFVNDGIDVYAGTIVDNFFNKPADDSPVFIKVALGDQRLTITGNNGNWYGTHLTDADVTKCTIGSNTSLNGGNQSSGNRQPGRITNEYDVRKSASPTLLRTGNFDTDRITKIYRFDGTSQGTKPSGVAGGFIESVFTVEADWGYQKLYQTNNLNMYVRYFFGGSWTTWVKFTGV